MDKQTAVHVQLKYYSVIKNNEVLIHMPFMNYTNIMLNVKDRKKIHCVISFL